MLAQVIVRRFDPIGLMRLMSSAIPSRSRSRPERPPAPPADRQLDHGGPRHARGDAGRGRARDRGRRRSVAKGRSGAQLATSSPGAEPVRPARRRHRRARSSARRIIVGIATGMALPVGVLVALYLTEFAPTRLAAPSSSCSTSWPACRRSSIGVFIYGLLVVGHQQSGYRRRVRARDRDAPARRARHAGGAAARAVRTARGEPGARRSRWRTVLGIILPTAFGGILTGAVLAVARAAGETAPLLFTTSIFAERDHDRRQRMRCRTSRS